MTTAATTTPPAPAAATTKHLPNFIVPGSAKCGSTSLHAYLDAHPQIAMSRPKQTHYFDADGLYEKGLDWYATCFDHVTNEKAIGETTPTYIHGRYIAERINNDLPGVKLLFIFRDPVKRAYSNYWHAYRRGRRIGSFVETMDDPNCRHFWEQSRYAKYLRDYIDVFGRDRCHWILLEQLKSEPNDTLREIWKFLGVDESVRVDEAERGERKNTHKMPRSMALMRFANDHLTPAGQPENVSNYDEEGNLEIHFTTPKFGLIRRALMRVINTVNFKPAEYPPLSDEDAKKVATLFKQDNKEFADITGLDIHTWWKFA